MSYLTDDERHSLLRAIDTSRRAGLIQSDSIRDQVAHEVERIVRAHRAVALREAVRDMRAAWQGSWNLSSPFDPETHYSVDVWLECRADQIENGDTE